MNYFESNIFCERANELFGKTGQKELSSKTGISQAVISSIKTKSIKSPSADTIYLIANYFNVSTDWLLGLTDIKSTDKATKELCDTLGLSEEAIKTIKQKTVNEALNYLFYQHNFSKSLNNARNLTACREYEFSLLEKLSQFIKLLKKDNTCDTFFKISQDGEFIKGSLIFDTENGELFSNDIIGIEFENEAIENCSPTYSLTALQMQEILNDITTQLQFHIKAKNLLGYTGEFE